MLPETRKILDDFYGPFNKRLAILTGDDSFRWDLYRPIPDSGIQSFAQNQIQPKQKNRR
jgi:hypothetical protein